MSLLVLHLLSLLFFSSARAEASAVCTRYTKYPADLADSSFHADSGNCSTYRHVIEVEATSPSQATIFYLEMADSSANVYVEDQIIENGASKYVRRQTEAWVGSAWVSAYNSSTRVVFETHQSTENAVIKGNFIRSTDHPQCAYPFQRFTGSTRFIADTGHVEQPFLPCVVLVEVRPSHYVKGTIEFVEEIDGVYVYEYHNATLNTLIAKKNSTFSFESQKNYIMISYKLGSAVKEFRLNEASIDCGCNETVHRNFESVRSFSFPQPGNDSSEWSSEKIKRCSSMSCFENIKTDMHDGMCMSFYYDNEDVQNEHVQVEHVVIRTSESVIDLTGYVPTMIHHFCFPNTTSIELVYYKEDQHDGPTVMMGNHRIAEGCSCPKIAGNSLEVHFPESCGIIDCFWDLPINTDTTVVDYSIPKDSIEDFVFYVDGGSDDSFVGMSTIEINDYLMFDAGVRLHLWFHRRGTGSAKTHIKVNMMNECTCHDGIIELESDKDRIFTSPNWPRPYCNNMDCRYVFTAPSNHRINFTMNDANLEYPGDFVRFFDGRNESTKPILGGVITSEKLGHTYSTTDNVLTVTFHSDHQLVHAGFHAVIRAVPPESNRKLHYILWISLGAVGVVCLLVLIVCCVRKLRN